VTQKNLVYSQAIASFFTGGSLICLILLFFHTFPHLRFLDSRTLYGPWLEEGLKFLTILILIKIAYLTPTTIPFLGIGFGFMEQLAYFINRNDFRDRRIIVLWVHIILGLVMAYFFYLAQKERKILLKIIWYLFAFLVPALIHLYWNFIGSLG
jgi:hypothetical protein